MPKKSFKRKKEWKAMVRENNRAGRVNDEAGRWVTSTRSPTAYQMSLSGALHKKV